MGAQDRPNGVCTNDVGGVFSLRFASTTQLYLALRTLMCINNTLDVGIHEWGLEARCIDPSHVSMGVLKIPREAFSEYSFSGEARFTLVVEKLLPALSSAGEGWVHIYQQRESVGVVAEFKDGSVIVETEDTIGPIPDPKVEFEVQALLILDELRKLVVQATRAGCANLRFTAQGDRFRVYSCGLTKTFSPIWFRHSTDNTEATYSLTQLRGMIINSNRRPRVVQASFGNTKPLSLSYILPLSYTLSAAHLKYFLAPIQLEG
ncbi:MAG: hypothetical protein QW514_00895 [Thermoprotei archaeon]